ncbi:MAG TPA: hypothetical protein VIA80_05245 [Hyphomonadaceae bacterium]|jgi:hypothetical protein
MTDIAAGKVPILKCFEQAWRFLFDHWRLLAPAAIAPALANGIALALSPVNTTGAGNPMSELTGFAIVTIASVFFTAAVLRKIVRDEFIPPLGLAFGQDETRLLGVLGCYLAIFVPPVVLLAVVFQVFLLSRIAASPEELAELMADSERFSEAVLQQLGAGGLLLLDVILVALVIIAVVALARLSMVNAATIGEKKVVFFQSWSWSKGNVLRILAALVITALPATLLDLIVAAVVLGLAGAGPAPVQAVAGAVTGFIQSLLSIPAIALGAILYQGLRPPAFVAK